MNKKQSYPILVLLGAVAITALLFVTRPELAADEFREVLTNVRAMRVHTSTEYLEVLSQGTVQPRSESQLISEVSGKVVELSGSMVSGGGFEKGALLLKLDPADYEAEVARRRASLSRARIEHEHARDEHARMTKLHTQKLASQSQLDEARRRTDIAEANHAEAQIELDTAQRDLERTTIYAPYDGRVREESVDVGQFVSRGGVIGTLYATDFVEIRLPLASAQLSFLDIALDQQGQLLPERAAPVVISGEYGAQKFKWDGMLERTEAEIDARSRMLYGVAVVENILDDGIPPLMVGLFVNATIRGRQVENVVRLPRSVIRDDSRVLVIDEDNRLHFRSVEILRIEHDEVVIQSGLADGEMVCLSPLQAVVDGMKVNPIPVNSEA